MRARPLPSPPPQAGEGADRILSLVLIPYRRILHQRPGSPAHYRNFDVHRQTEVLRMLACRREYSLSSIRELCVMPHEVFMKQRRGYGKEVLPKLQAYHVYKGHACGVGLSARAMETTTMFAAPTDKCPVCFGNDLEPDFFLTLPTNQPGKWDRCRTCGLMFMNPRLLPDEMYKIYTKPEYWAAAYGNYFENEPLRLENSQSRLDLCAPYIPKSGRLLDLGCATGFFAAVASKNGFDVVGVDINPDMIEFGRRQYGIDLRAGRVEDCDFCPTSFDIVSMWGLDCHFFDFRATFEKIVGWLKPGGCLLFAYQDYGHWIRWFFPKIKQEPNVYYGLTRESFVRLMRQLGMQIVMQRTSVEVTQLNRIIANLKIGLQLPIIGQTKVRIITPSYLLVVARKEAPLN